jgi:hypothetical protein
MESIAAVSPGDDYQPAADQENLAGSAAAPQPTASPTYPVTQQVNTSFDSGTFVSTFAQDHLYPGACP